MNVGEFERNAIDATHWQDGFGLDDGFAAGSRSSIGLSLACPLALLFTVSKFVVVPKFVELSPAATPSYVVMSDCTACCQGDQVEMSSDVAAPEFSTGVLPSPETLPAPAPGPAPELAPAPAPAPTATWVPATPQNRKPAPAPTPAPQPVPTPKPTPAPPKDESDSLDDLFKEEPSTGADAKQATPASADAPIPAESKQTAGANASAPMRDDSAVQDAAAKPAAAADDIDFGDAAPDKADDSADANQPEPDMANGLDSLPEPDGATEPDDSMEPDSGIEPDNADEPADEMPAKDEPDDKTSLAPVESIGDLASDEMNSPTEVNAGDANASSVQPASDRPMAADGMRLWTDNTGTHQVMARLVKVFDGKVRLQKETGRFTTVPLQRLSQGDLAFVRRQAPALASAFSQQTASNQTGLGR